MTTALELTATPELRQRYELVVYQEGWRLGGKGASGRNAEMAQRIEEHGLHIWSGFYVNAFRCMRQVYAEAARPEGCGLRTFEDAFKPHNTVSWQEYFLGRWESWTEEMEERPDEKAGEPPGPVPTPFRLLLGMAPWAIGFLVNVKRCWTQTNSKILHPRLPSWMAWVSDVARLIWALAGFAFVYFTNQLMHLTHRALRRPVMSADTTASGPLERWMLSMRRRVIRRVEQQPDILRLFILLDCAFCILRGMVVDGLLWRGFDCLDDEDFRAWLLRMGAIPEITVNSGIVRGTYDYIFAYVKGDTQRPSLAAGVALRMVLRLLLTYQRSVFWRMEAGMGDTIFSPIYEVLKKRGVKFLFFHQVENLGVSTDKKSIATVRIRRQVTLAEGRQPWEYDPLVDVNRVPSWPTEPLYGQIEPGEATRLKAERVNLCSPWSTWQCPETLTLEKGRDFDIVVLGASLAALPVIGSELLAPGTGSERLRRMHEKVQTVQTLAMQLWLKPDLSGMGWKDGSTILTGYGEPYDTWADMTHLLPREQWPAGAMPGNISYFCGPLAEQDVAPPFGTHPEYPEEQTERAKAIAAEWLAKYTAGMWPSAVARGTSGDLDRSLLISVRGGGDQERFDAQYFRGNVVPSDRYVISLPGTTQYRLRSDESGYDNLYLTGDWLRTGLNYGCVEGTVMGGMQAARAISGSPKEIYGESDFCKTR